MDAQKTVSETTQLVGLFTGACSRFFQRKYGDKAIQQIESTINNDRVLSLASVNVLVLELLKDPTVPPQ
jgi:hypothetical protein